MFMKGSKPMQFLGFRYYNEQDIEDDNIKLWHYVQCPDGSIISGPWGPYAVPFQDEFAKFVLTLIDSSGE